MRITPEETVNILGPCTNDVADCEIFRVSIALADKGPGDSEYKKIRQELVKAACKQCARYYLIDLIPNSSDSIDIEGN